MPATPTKPLAGRIAVVTGASRGIGRAIANQLAGLGMKVIGTATTDAGAASIGEALAAFDGCRGLCLNVNHGPALDAAIDGIAKEHGALHVLVNNAGITRDMLSMRLKDEDWDAVLDTNLKAVFRACRAAGTTPALIDAFFAYTEHALIVSSARVINPASRRVIEKCGFQWTGAGLTRVRAIGASVPVDRFRLEKRMWASLRAWGASAHPTQGWRAQRH